MKKNYCDGCGEELSRNYVTQRLENEHQFHFMQGPECKSTTARVEVMAGVDGTFNSGDLCLSCLYDAVTGGEYSKFKQEAQVQYRRCLQLQVELSETYQKLKEVYEKLRQKAPHLQSETSFTPPHF